MWIALITVLFMLPPNLLTGYTFGGALALLTIYYFAWARRHFEGPAALQTPRTIENPSAIENRAQAKSLPYRCGGRFSSPLVARQGHRDRLKTCRTTERP